MKQTTISTLSAFQFLYMLKSSERNTIIGATVILPKYFTKSTTCIYRGYTEKNKTHIKIVSNSAEIIKKDQKIYIYNDHSEITNLTLIILNN